MQHFLETQFPTDISYGATGGPQFSTDIITTHAGHEQRNSNWQHPIARYNISSGIKSEAQWAQLIAFFRLCKGRAIGFRYKDWSDYTGKNQIIGMGDGTQKTFQLVKYYEVGEHSIKRTIHKPVTHTITLYGDSLIISPQYIDSTTGIIALKSAPALGTVVSADFEFDVPVRFDTDEMQLAVDSYQAGSWQNIPLVEIRV